MNITEILSHLARDLKIRPDSGRYTEKLRQLGLLVSSHAAITGSDQWSIHHPLADCDVIFENQAPEFRIKYAEGEYQVRFPSDSPTTSLSPADPHSLDLPSSPDPDPRIASIQSLACQICLTLITHPAEDHPTILV